VRLIQTHISWVFVASPFVFKVKKPINLGFADFSTLEKRRHFCQREVELNRRLCPEIYLDVVPIFKAASGFSFNSEGEIAEYCVQMKELSRGWFLGELLTKNLVGEAEINRVISRLHRFYQSQSPSPEIELWGTPEKLKISTGENFAQVEPFVGKTISAAAFETVRHFTNRFYAVHGKLFRERIQQHRVRDCHGDLHLDHIHITPDTLSIFDCIEFNDRFRLSMSPMISLFWRWTSISKQEATWQICLSEMRRANFATMTCCNWQTSTSVTEPLCAEKWRAFKRLRKKRKILRSMKNKRRAISVLPCAMS